VAGEKSLVHRTNVLWLDWLACVRLAIVTLIMNANHQPIPAHLVPARTNRHQSPTGFTLIELGNWRVRRICCAFSSRLGG